MTTTTVIKVDQSGVHSGGLVADVPLLIFKLKAPPTPPT